MKTAICFPPSCSTAKENEFESCRGEGRFTINIGFGLSLLGYEVHIINDWNITVPKKIWNNVYINNKPIYDEYDVAFTFSGANMMRTIRYKKGMYMGYETRHISDVTELNKILETPLIFTCPYKGFIDYNNNRAPFKVYYLPHLMPIPSINIGFLPYNYNPERNELKVYLNFSQWKDSTDSHVKWSDKQYLAVNFLRAKFKDKKVKLYVHVENKDAIKKCHIKGDETYYFLNDKNYYDDVINLIKRMDICITKGGWYDLSGCVNDIISLGKPFIYVVDSPPTDKPILNHLYNCPKSIIYSQEPNIDSIKKLERFINNPELSYNCFKYTSRDLDFINWKEIAKHFFN